MSKILYPVGTKVVIKKNLGTQPERVGMIAEVIDYLKGDKAPMFPEGRNPYIVQFEDGAISSAHVQELKRYTPNNSKKVTESATRNVEFNKGSDMPSPAQCQCDMSNYVSRQELTETLQLVNEALMYEIVEAEARNTDRLMRMAEMTDRNFCKVKRQFKSLEHDDD